MRKHLKLGWVNVALVMGSLIICFICTELALRLTEFSYPTFQVYDDHFGSILRPNVEGWYREEGDAFVRINSEGWRDVEHTREKPPDTVRIAILGDSFADALQVPLEDTFWSVLGRKLQECKAFGGRQIEMLNFGVSSYGTGQELLVLQQHVWKFDPDLVVLAFLTANDINDNAKVFSTNFRPYFVYDNGSLALDMSFREIRPYRLRRSAPWMLFVKASDTLRIVQALNLVRNRMTQDFQSKASEFGLYDEVYLKPINGDWEEAWKITEELILKIRNEIRVRGKQFLLVILSNGIQVHPHAEVREQFMKRIGIADLFYPDRRLQALAQREGIPFIALAPLLLQYAEANHAFLHGFANTRWGAGHWNSLGHQVAGESIATRLCSNSTDPALPLVSANRSMKIF